jgi:KDO2-lipid IV(A) lauroyltransferase
MSNNKISFKHRLEYGIFISYITSIKLSPFFMQSLHRATLNILFKVLSRRHSRIVSENLQMAFPEKTADEIKTLKRRIYKHFSTIFTQIIYLYVKQNPEKTLPDIQIRNSQALEDILNRGKGVILFSAHFGNWELVPFIISRKLKRKTHNVARIMDNPLIEKRVIRFREYMGSRIIHKKGSIKTILKELKNNQIIGMIIDQNTLPEEGVFVDFFSRKVCAIPSVSMLHLKRNIPIVPVFIHYEPDKIVFEISDEVSFQKSGNFEDDLVRLTQYCNTLIEQKVRQYPEQWLWFHQRWKSKPSGESHETG